MFQVKYFPNSFGLEKMVIYKIVYIILNVNILFQQKLSTRTFRKTLLRTNFKQRDNIALTLPNILLQDTCFGVATTIVTDIWCIYGNY